MPPDTIIKDFDILEDALSGLSPGSVSFKIYNLGLECMKERLHYGIIIAISGRTHAL